MVSTEVLSPRQRDCARVFEKMFDVYQGDIARPIRIDSNYASLGQAEINEAGRWDVSVNSGVARFRGLTLERARNLRARIPVEVLEGYIMFRAKNPSRQPSDFFEMAVSHEFGHVIFNEIVSKNWNSLVGSPLELSDDLPDEIRPHSEAFACWFSDRVIGVRRPWMYTGIYQKSSLSNSELREDCLYRGLWELTHEHGHGASFDTGLLMESFAKHDPAAKENGFLYRAA